MNNSIKIRMAIMIVTMCAIVFGLGYTLGVRDGGKYAMEVTKQNDKPTRR